MEEGCNSDLDEIFAPPESVRGLKELDRSLFMKVVTVPAISTPAKQCSHFLQRLKCHVLKYPGVKKIISGSSENERLLLLSPGENGRLNEEDLLWIKTNNGRLTHYSVTMTYDNYSIGSVLKAVLPPNEVKDIPSAFETVGHIAHVNLRNEQEPYKALIGQVLLDKLANIKTVVNKLSSIDETYRTFKMELLAGESNMTATVKENGCSFHFDFSKVYWNSRLHTEHKRVINTLKHNDIVLDMFAGVGPFSIPACKKGCRVFANDLNPFSYRALLDNAKRNNITLSVYNLDGRDFICQVKNELLPIIQEVPSTSVHILMNLPALAVEFLDSLKGLYFGLVHNSDIQKPLIHCYTFSKSTTPEQDVIDSVEKKLSTKLESFTVSSVRDVSPNKLMMKVTFPLPYDILFDGSVLGMKHSRSDYSDDTSTCSPANKKSCP